MRAHLIVFVTAIIFCAGCSRQAYRSWADRDAYRLLKSRQLDNRWKIPERTIEPDPRSRLADFNDQDCGPLPPDDPTASRYMRYPFSSKKRVNHWDQRGQLESLDGKQWMDYLPRNNNREIELDQQLTVELALIHNREFQTRVEQLYASALRLSQNRFEYQLNWFGGSDTNFNANGDGGAAVRDLQTTNQVGFRRNLATGGQFATTLANAFTWQLGGSGNSNLASGNMLFSLTQPVLRGAFRHVRTESLTQAERTLLYDVRAFARFRRQFYFNIVSQYLTLLNQSQSVRIEEENLRNLELNLEEHNVLESRGLVSPIQVDQVFQRLQSGRLSLISSQQALQTSLDQFKFQLGLPARVEIKLDQSILNPFQLNSPEVESLQAETEEFEQTLMEYLPPETAPEKFLTETYTKIKAFSADLEQQLPLVRAELRQWTDEIKKPADENNAAEMIDYKQNIDLAKRLKMFLDDLGTQIESAKKQYEQPLDELNILVDAPSPDGEENEKSAIKSWRKLQTLIAQPGGLKDRINTLFVTQTQIRLFLIKIKPIDLAQDLAVEIALDNRLDLMNSRAAVVDSYRQIEIAANQLKSDLSVTTGANLKTDPTKDNPLRFDGDENQYTVGLEFDGPLNRFSERNVYRLAQIGYQQQRRLYMADEDAIVNAVRLDLRQLQTNRFNFQIARQQLITATRQVEQAQFNLRTATTGDSSLTQDLLQALQSLRDTKNSLISSWINYEISRIGLFVDLELLQLDEQGNWINEQENFDSLKPSESTERVDVDALERPGDSDGQLNDARKNDASGESAEQSGS